MKTNKLFKSVLSCMLVLAMLFGCSAMFAGCKETVSSKDLTPDQHLQKVWGEQIANVVKGLANVSDSMGDASLPVPEQTGMSIRLHIDDAVLGGIASGLGFEGDMSILSDIRLDMFTDMTGEFDKLQFLLSLKGEQIITLNVLMNMAQYLIYAGSPELNDTYIKFDGSEMAGSAAMMDPSTVTNLMKALPDGETLTSLLGRYTAILLAGIKNVEKGPVKLEAEGISQDATALVLTVYEKDLVDLAKEILTTAKDDAQLKTVIENVAAALNEEGVETGDLAGSLQEAINEKLEELNEIEEFDTENPMLISTYVDADDNIIGFKFEMKDASQGAFYAYNVTSGDNVASIIAVEQETGAVLRFSGKGTMNGGKLSGEYKLHYNDGEFLDADYLNISVKDFSDEGGAINLKPTAELLQAMGLNMNLSFFTFQMTFTSDSVGLSIVNDGKELGSLTISIAEEKDLAFDVPDKTVDAFDSEAMQEWASKLNLEGILNKLRGMGAGPLIDYIQGLMNQGGGYAEPDYSTGF
ncbi:MAG: hypothetical protein E7447_05385 [Ruminococcaceae bacterium]|nr:hypothetical protein [Oscillospiraceae bacterium]